MTRNHTLLPSDIAAFEALGVTPSTLELARVRRVTHNEASDICGIRYHSDHLEGLAIPYLNPGEDRIVAWRVRRDHPELDADGKPRAKYLSSPDRRHLYFGPNCCPYLSDPAVPAIVVEAEKSVLALYEAEIRAGRGHALLVGLGGCWGWRGVIGRAEGPDGARADEKGPLPDFDRIVWTGRDVVILFDANAAGNEKVRAARRALATELAGRGAHVLLADVPVEEGVNGPDDYLGKHGDAALFQLVDAAHRANQVARKGKSGQPKQGRDVQFEDPEPWLHRVNGAVLLATMAATFDRYLALPDHASTALALWVLHAFTIEAWFTSPILAITSPLKRCGKTLLLIVLGALVPRRLFAANVTPAVLFRTIEKYGPTLLIDEADTFIRDNDELRGVLNSGHTRTTAVVIRAVGEDHDPRAFSTWCPKAIALIGKLPDTLGDRAIEIAMRRRTASETVQRLRQDRIETECSDARRQALRWAADHAEALGESDPPVPLSLHDRAADCWRPLLALADRAGGDWPIRAREAAQALSGVTDDANQSLPVLLLADVRAIFSARSVDALGSLELVKALRALESKPWKAWGKDNKGLTTYALARLLKDFRVHRQKLRVRDKTPNGYTRRSFEDAWARYLGSEVEHWNNVNESGHESAISQVEQAVVRSGSESPLSPNNDGICSSVPVQTGETKETDESGDDWEAMW